MALSYDTITAIVNAKYLPKMFDVIFKGTNYLADKLMRNYKTFTERKIVQDLEYAESTSVGFVGRLAPVTLIDEELVTASEWTPKMMYGTMVIAKEDELRCNSTMAVQKILTVKTNNLQKSIERYFATHLWTRGVTALPDSNGFETIDRLVNNHATTAIGGIPSSGNVATWWKSQIINLVTDAHYSGCDPTNEDDLLNSTKKTFLLRLFDRLQGVAKFYGGGRIPDIIVVPQYIAGLFTFIQETKRRLSENAAAAKAGFKLWDYNGSAIMPDDYMVAAQTGDNDGRMYALHSDNMYMFFNAGAKFTAEPFMQSETIIGRSSKVIAYGNLVISNRQGAACMTNIRSPKSWIDVNGSLPSSN